MTIPTLTLSSLKMFMRNRQSLIFTLFIPFVFISIFSLVGFDKAPQIDLGVVSANPTPSTQQFLETLDQMSVFNIHKGSEADERAALNKGDRALVMVVPDALLPDPAAKTPPKPQTVTLLKNIAQEQQASTTITILSQTFDKTTLAVAKAPQLFNLDVQSINAKKVKYIDFLLPGIVAMSIMQVAVFSVAFVFTDYKEKGILKRLIATPMRPYQFVTANVITRLLVALVQAGLLLGFGILVFHSQVFGSWFLVALIALLGSLMFLGLGFTISGLAKTTDSVPALANLLVFPMMFLSGIFFPTNVMPGWLQKVVHYLPLTPFAHAMRETVGNGATIGAIRADLYWMLAWVAVLSVLAVLTFGMEEKRQ